MLIFVVLVLCNVVLAIIFKNFAKYQINNLNAIVFNYGVCVAVASLFLGRFVIPMDLFSKPWFPYCVIMALLFIFGFNILALSFQKAGVAITTIIQRMSMILPIAFAVTFFDESLSLLKGLGILSAVSAIILVNLPEKKGELRAVPKDILWLPILTFLISGVIEIILYYVGAAGLLTDDGIVFTASSFGIAGILGAIYVTIQVLRSKTSVNKKDLLGGVVLGLPNFMTIYLLLVLLEKGWDGSVLFPLSNISILALTTMVGVVLYSEKLYRYRIIGLGFSLLAIGLLALG